MANYERGVYEPPSDDIRVFDGGDDDIGEEGSRLPLLIVIALLVLAAFAGVVWLAYTQGVQRGRTDAPRIIAATPGPDKVAPKNPGGETDQYQGLKIYEQPAPPDEEVDNGEAEKTSQAPALRPQTDTQSSPQQATAPPRELAPKKPASVQQAKAQPAAPAKTAVASTPAASAPVVTTPVANGSMLLQIGSYKSQSEADTAWAAFKKRHPIAGGYLPYVKQVDLGAKGTWYRLRIGPFDGKAAASDFCDKLKADGASCFPSKP